MVKPDRNLVDLLIATFDTVEDVDYFFDQLKSPDWIEPLASAELFRYPPEPIRVDGGIQFPPWSASRYLARMAGVSPTSVRRVLLDLPATDNVRVLHDIADAVLAIPPEMAVEFVPRMVDWLESPFQLLLPTKLGALLRRVALSGLSEPALTLAATLFRIHSGNSMQVGGDDSSFKSLTETASSVHPIEFERLIEECRHDFIAGTGLRGLEFLSDLLGAAMEMETRDPADSKNDYSWIWRPSIAPHEQNRVPSVRNSIVSAVLDAALQLASSSYKLDEIIDILESREWSVLRRIALEVLHQCAPQRSAVVSSRLTNPELMFDPALHHEYWVLLHDRFAKLTLKQQVAIIEAIRRAPALFRDPDGPYADILEAAPEYWQAQLLAAIADDLSSDWRAWFDELVAKGRANEHPDFQSYSSRGFVGPTSPISDTEFAAMSDDQLMEYLQTWEPEHGWGKPSPEGLGRALAASVRAAPTRFAEHAAKFRSLDPTYVNSFLSAFREVAMNREPFPWEPILQLSEWVVQQDREIPGRVSEYGNLDSGWVWTRSTIVHLLDVGFNDSPAEIPFECRSLAWSVLRPLTDDPHPSVEEEERYGGPNMDPSTYAINTVRGQAIESVIKYALWVNRHLGDSTEDAQTAGFDRMLEAREVLDQHLAPGNDPSCAVHSMYGQWFPWLQLLDPAWAEHNQSRIFPPEDEDFLFWEAAWDAYIGFCQPFDSVFGLLKDEYERAVTRIVSASPDRKHPMLGLDHLGQHLMVFYLRGRVGLDDRLLRVFHHKAPPDLRASALEFVGRSFYSIDDRSVHPYPNIAPEVIERARALWAMRLEVASQAASQDEYRKEIGEFGWWFLYPNFDEKWALAQLVAALRLAGFVEFSHMVVQRLAELVATRPVPVLTALQLLIGSDHRASLSLGWESVTDILRSALRHPDAGVRQQAEALTHELGTRGYRQFRDLLKEAK